MSKFNDGESTLETRERITGRITLCSKVLNKIQVMNIGEVHSFKDLFIFTATDIGVLWRPHNISPHYTIV